MKALLLVALALLPLANASGPPDLDEFSVCEGVHLSLGTVEVCVSRDRTWYCYGVWATGLRPVADCFQFIGP